MNVTSLSTRLTPLLDETYAAASLTALLDGAPEDVRLGANPGELIVPAVTVQGLGAYSPTEGYTEGSLTYQNETVTCNFDRSRVFNVSLLEDLDAAAVAFGRMAGAFIRRKVAPELDAFRLSQYASAAGISKATGALADGGAVLTALRTAVTQMDEDQIPMEERCLFITPALHGLVEDLDTTKSREIMRRFAAVVDVPQARFYTAITQKSGKLVSASDDQTAGGYAKASGAKDINFMVIHKPSVLQYQLHAAPKILLPEQNPDADGYKFGYHNLGIAKVQETLEKGVYLHCKA